MNRLPDRSIPASESAHWKRRLSLFGLGAIGTLGWAPVSWPVVALAAFATLFAVVNRSQAPRMAIESAFCFALGLHTAGHGWAYRALVDHTAAGALLALLGTAIFVAYLTLFTVVPCWTYLAIQRHFRPVESRCRLGAGIHWGDTLLLASLLTLAEYARGWFLGGFNSLSAGYLFSDSPLRGWPPLLGVYGCALIFYLTAGSLASLFSGLNKPVLTPRTAMAPLSLLGRC